MFMNTFKHLLFVIFSCGLLIFSLSGYVLALPTIKQGSHGRDVLFLQQQLAAAGYDIKSLNGIFTKDTERAVATFQRDHKIKITGIVNNATWDALDKIKKQSDKKTSKEAIVKQNDTVNNNIKYTGQKIEKGNKELKKYVPNGKKFLNKNQVKTLISTAKRYVGTPYQFGGNTPKAFDCSGYLQYLFAQVGVTIPRTADEQYKLGVKASKKELESGDLVFFETYTSGASHCGIYLGKDQFIHASSSKGVRIDKLSDQYWSTKFLTGKKIIK